MSSNVLFSCKSDSTITNVRPSVIKQSPSTALNHHHPSSFIIHHSSLISRLLSFSACFTSSIYYKCTSILLREAFNRNKRKNIWKFPYDGIIFRHFTVFPLSYRKFHVLLKASLRDCTLISISYFGIFYTKCHLC